VATIDPNATISDQYQSTVLELKAGGSIVGRITNEDAKNYYISQNPFAPNDIKTVSKSTVALKKNGDVSIMMPGLINRLNEEELKVSPNFSMDKILNCFLLVIIVIGSPIVV
jgi:hypothetical protein